LRLSPRISGSTSTSTGVISRFHAHFNNTLLGKRGFDSGMAKLGGTRAEAVEAFLKLGPHQRVSEYRARQAALDEEGIKLDKQQEMLNHRETWMAGNVSKGELRRLYFESVNKSRQLSALRNFLGDITPAYNQACHEVNILSAGERKGDSPDKSPVKTRLKTQSDWSIDSVEGFAEILRL